MYMVNFTGASSLQSVYMCVSCVLCVPSCNIQDLGEARAFVSLPPNHSHSVFLFGILSSLLYNSAHNLFVHTFESFKF